MTDISEKAKAVLAESKARGKSKRAEYRRAQKEREAAERHVSIWSPQYKEDGRPGPQVALVTCPIPEILFGGARGGGKTDGVLGCWLLHADRYGEYAKGMFIRRQFKQLEDVQNRCMMLFPKVGAVFNKGDATWVFANGATLKMRHLWDESDTDLYQGQQYNFLAFEELTQWPTPAPINKMRATLRSAQGVPCRMYCTANPGGAGHCVPYGEVLTPDGWKDIREFQVGDPVMTVKADGSLVSSVVSQVHRSHYAGPMINVNARGLRMICTPNHKVAKVGGVRGEGRNAKFSLVPYDDLPGQATILRSVEWQGTPLPDIVPETYPTRARRLSQPKSLSGKLYCSLLGWMLSEGCLIDRDKAFSIAQMKPVQREIIRQLLEDECGFSVSWSATEARVHCADWWHHFRDIGYCREKKVPYFIKQATKEELYALFEAMMDGDGHWVTRGKSGQYYTISKQLADDVAEIALKLGYIVSVGQRQRPNRNGPCYEIYFKTVKSGGTELLTGNHKYLVETQTKRRSDINEIDFDGEVYCIGVENTHSFVLRQDGSVWVSGNSWVKARYITPNPKGMMPIVDPETGDTRVFIPSRLEDNLALLNNDPTYKKRLLASGNAAIVKAWLYGDWDVLAGGFIDDIFRQDKHLLDPFEIPQTWRWRRSFDWGSAAPASLGMWAISDGNPVRALDGFVFPRGSLIRVDEWYTCAYKQGNIEPNVGLRLTNIALGNGIGNRSLGRTWSGCVADPSIYAQPGRQSIYSEMQKGAADAGHTLIFNPANNDRVAGWQKMRDMLEAAAQDIPEKPGLWSFSTCTHFARTVPVLQRDDKKPDDIDTDQEDHVADETRYACMTGGRSVVEGSLTGH